MIRQFEEAQVVEKSKINFSGFKQVLNAEGVDQEAKVYCKDKYEDI